MWVQYRIAEILVDVSRSPGVIDFDCFICVISKPLKKHLV